jgi:hypothetical protein
MENSQCIGLNTSKHLTMKLTYPATVDFDSGKYHQCLIQNVYLFLYLKLWSKSVVLNLLPKPGLQKIVMTCLVG